MDKEIKKEGECEHKNIERQGLWDGKADNGTPIGGPLVYCSDCSQKIYMQWETYYANRRKYSADHTPPPIS